MSKSLVLVYLAVLFLHTHFSNSVGVPISSEGGEIGPILGRNGAAGGFSSFPDQEEDIMPSEISRRVLMMQKKRYISYETLRRDMVPCQKPGASYYDCRPGQANSYGRGCEIITRCARDTSNTKT